MVDDWLLFLRTVLTNMFTLKIGTYTIFHIFNAIACISVVSSALVIRVKRGL